MYVKPIANLLEDYQISVSDTSLPCGLVVHINLIIACLVQAFDDRLLKMRINHHNQQPY